jgi:poly-gamma-glutamate synthesis protein (capsule biosynthesis protein)
VTAARLVAVGDLMLGDSATCVGFGFRSRVSARSLADGLARLPELRAADVGFGNLEACLSDAGWHDRGWTGAQMRGRPEYARVLADAGFTVLNVANNHATQHGAAAFTESVARLQDAGLAVCGLRGTAPWSSEPVRLAVRGARLGILGYCFRPRQYGAAQPGYAEGTPEEVVADVRRLAAEGRAVVVSLHWGEEFVPVPSTHEVQIGRAIVDAGAAVVLGHHPHVSRPVESYRGAIIAYSLGNLAADMIWYAPLRHGLMVDCAVGGGAVDPVRVARHYVDDRFLPQPTDAVPLQGAVTGLGDAEYRDEVRRTIARQRGALYRYTLRNLWRFSPRVFAAMAGRTLANKLTALTARATREPA